MKERNMKSAVISNSSIFANEQILYRSPVWLASKSFIGYFSEVLGYENPDMDVLTVYSVPTKSAKHPVGVDAKDVIQGVFNDLGQERISYGHYYHSLFRYYYFWNFKRNQI
eukprot:CAMPEP_0176343036 /NCGR_PEP_ID=MMETSP0126-20121128/3640_1 /TAXON_ID=141414 ORGANISM="Strombidinopsis acuminatum, Strain SPMC142" /NCGR_SAMPLE_ID=MMETSP0126 /ASSEMBLY_ACC=CAM_ASM_000229 /LENGTH=110 /DNA_ID=CAMNT_0017688779 /DNA_START=547 /DNA_END=879 /DNA_ORIENTATION=-